MRFYTYFVSCFAFCGAWIILIVAGIWIYGGKSLPPPPLTPSVSFNEKAEFLRNRKNLDCDVMSIGSSMAFNNLKSSHIANALPKGQTYLNVGSWGMKIKHMRAFLEFLLKRSHPKMILISSGPADFYIDNRESAVFDERELADYLDGKPKWLFHVRHFDLVYYFKNSRTLPLWRSRNDIYPSLQMDAWGAANLDIPRANINPFRWELIFEPGQIDTSQYRELKQLSMFLKTKGVQLVWVQIPMREASIPQKSAADLNVFFTRTRQIITENGHVFLNAHEVLKFSDEMFADWTHLNGDGTAKYTDFIVEKIFSNNRAF